MPGPSPPPPPSPPPVPPRWRGESSGRGRTATRASSRRRQAFAVLAAMLGLVGVLVGLLSWIRPLPRPLFVPLWVGEYRAPRLPSSPAAGADLDALRAGGYFPRVVGEAQGNQDRFTLAENLAALKSSGAAESVVLYVSAGARVGPSGQVAILPADADPADPRTWLPLRDVLVALRDHGSRHKLLILDIGRPRAVADPGLPGDDDAAARIPAELAAVADPRRLVLTACGPGQVALASGDLGRSAFGYYVEEALRGWVEADSPRARREGIVTARELAEFVAARVDRWALRNRGFRQTPRLLGSASDFPLVALAYGRPWPHLPVPEPRAYPAWLRDGWAQRDRWRRDGTYREAPRAFRRWEVALAAADRDWREGADPDRVRQELLPRLDDLKPRLATSRPRPRPRSLGLAAGLGWTPDPAAAVAVKDWLGRWAEQTQGQPPAQAEATTAKLIAAFPARSDRDLAWGVFHLAAEADDPPAATIRVLDRLLRARQPRPLFFETLALRRLAELADVPPWHAGLAQRALQVVRAGEAAAGRAGPLPWVRDLLDRAALARHDGEILLMARGYADPAAAEALLRQAGDLYERIAARQETVDQARRGAEDALADLPAFVPYLDFAPDSEATWTAAVRAACAVLDALAAPAAPGPAGDRRRALADLERNSAGLRDRLDELLRPFAPAALARLLDASRRPEAGPEAGRAIDAVLGTPFPLAGDRAALWAAGQALSRRLLDSTLATDRGPGPVGTPSQSAPDEGPARQRADAERRARTSIGLLTLGGLDPAAIRELDAAAAGAVAAGGKPAAWAAAARLLRSAWAEWLPDQLRGRADPVARDRLGRIVPPTDPAPILDDPATDPTAHRLAREDAGLWAWLADRYTYEGLDLNASPLDAAAARECRDLVPDFVPGVDARLRDDGTTAGLAADHPETAATLRLQYVAPPRPATPVEVRFLQPAGDWLRIGPATTGAEGRRVLDDGPDSAPGFTLPPPTAAEQDVPLRIGLNPDAADTGTPPPAGFLVRVRVDGRDFHHKVPIAVRRAVDRLQILLSPDPRTPTAPRDALRLRPVKGWQPFTLYVRNPTDRPRDLAVEVRAADAPIPGGPVKLAIGPRSVAPVPFPEVPARADAPLPELAGPLQIRLLDRDRKDEEPEILSVPVGIAAPREYVTVDAVQFAPAVAESGGKNRLSFTLRATTELAGPPCTVALVLPPDRIPGFLAVGDGTFRGPLPAAGGALELFAQGIRLESTAEGSGYVDLDIDDLKRGLRFRTTFAAQGGPTTPREDDRPALRLRAGRVAPTGASVPVVIEVDDPPPGATLELKLGRSPGGAFVADIARTFPTARRRHVGFHAGGPGGSLLFEASLADWSVVLDTTGLRGRRELRARLLDADGREVRAASLALVLDDLSPGDVRFVDPPKQARRGRPVTLRAAGVPTDSGIASATFFPGAPVDGKVPPGVATVPGTPLDPDKTTWTASLPLPDGKAATADVGVRFLSGAGVASVATAAIELLDADPVTPGILTGIVLEGPLPQPDLVVILGDDKNVERGRTTTAKDGTFRFAGLPPGSYQVFSSKPTSRTGRLVPATIKAGETADVTLELLR